MAAIRYPESFQAQFVIADAATPPRPDTRRVTAGATAVDLMPGVSAFPVLETGGRQVGLLIGDPIDPDREALIDGPWTAGAPLAAGAAPDAFVESQIYRLLGSFLFVLDDGAFRRVYLDADGSRSLVYDPSQRKAAATAGLLLDPQAYMGRFRRDLYEAFDVRRDGWFTAGLTAHEGVRRLMCNHYLDLADFTTHRHWPDGPFAETSDPDAAIAEICDSTRQGMRALAKTGRLAAALTAGNETRMLLSLARDFKDQIEFITVEAPGARVDRVRADELATRFGLRHTVLPFRKATQAQAEAWQARASHGITGNNMYAHPCIDPLEGRYYIGGLGGEVGRGFLWLDADRTTPIDVGAILDRLKLPRHPLLLEAVGAWHEPIAGWDPLSKLDLAYLELRMSTWAFTQSYVSPHVHHMHPLISRRSFTAMLSLPPEIRRRNGMIKMAIERCWPELLELPINRYGDYRDYVELAERGLRKPYRVWRKINQKIAARR